jgi:sec-independent protein translocase protein TatA/sec-independent protein translocase protein TatB
MDTTLQDVKSSTTDLKDVIKDSKREKPSRKKPDTTDAAQGTDTDTSEVPDPATDADTSSSSKNTKDDTPADKKNSNG